MAKSDKTSESAGWNPYLREAVALHRKSFIAVVIFSFVVNLLMLTTPLYLLQIFNRVVPSRSIDTLIFLTGIVVVAAITMSVLEAMRRYVFVQVGCWLDERLGGLVLSGAIARSVRKIRKSSPQALADLANVRRLFSSSALFPVLDAPWTPIFLLVLFALHPLIGWITLVGAIILFLLALVSELSTRKIINDANDASSKSRDVAAALLRNSDVIEAMGMRFNVVNVWGDYHQKAVDLQRTVSMRGNRIASVAKLVRTLLQIIVIGTAGYLVVNDQLTAGALIASLLLMRRAVAPMDRAIDSWKTIVSARRSFNRVSERLNEAPELNESRILPQPNGYLSVRHASFRYKPGAKLVLNDIKFRARPGEVIGLAGDTAAGKSTLARLLVGLAEPETGNIRLGGTNIGNWSSEDRGPFIGYLPQNAELFPGTMRQNIARMGEGDMDKIVEAATIAGVHDIATQFPAGYDTPIGDSGAYLSGGQRQRVALARAIYDSPLLVVLDEPDANLDTEGRAALAATLAELKRKGTIVFMISHQSSVLDNVDRLLILRNGAIDVVYEHDKSERKSSSRGKRSRVLPIKSSGKPE